MLVIAITHDAAGRPLRRQIADQGDLPLTDDQRRHLDMGLEVVLIRATQRVDVQPHSAKRPHAHR
jgi:hypothetical protein